MGEYVLIKKSELDPTRSCTSEEVGLLETAYPKSSYVELLSSLYDAELRVRCPCNIWWLVVDGEDREARYMRRVLGQELDVAESCKLCVRIRHRMNSGERPAPRPVRSILIPFDSSLAETASTDLPDSGTGGGDSAPYVPTPYGVLGHILHEAGLGNWEQYPPWWPLAEWTLFSRIGDVLDRHPVSPRVELSSETSWRHFSSFPGTRGNLVDVARRLHEDWPDRSRPHEAWVLGLVSHIERDGDKRTFSVSRILASFAAHLRATGGVDYGPYVVSLDSAFVTAPVTRGPYLALVAYTFQEGRPVYSARLVARNAALHAIASVDLPCPVDSHIERQIIGILRSFGEPFIKELVRDGDNLRVDFILPRLKLVLEINGMIDFALYAASKERIWPRICSSLRLMELDKVQFEVRRTVDEGELRCLLYGRADRGGGRNR